MNKEESFHRKKNKDPANYIFPDFLAKAMSKVDLRTQYEASMMSMSLMGIGLIVTIIYMCIYVDLQLWYKIFLIINCIAGIVFFWSYLVTTYQQYRNYIDTIKFQENFK